MNKQQFKQRVRDTFLVLIRQLDSMTQYLENQLITTVLKQCDCSLKNENAEIALEVLDEIVAEGIRNKRPIIKRLDPVGQVVHYIKVLQVDD